MKKNNPLYKIIKNIGFRDLSILFFVIGVTLTLVGCRNSPANKKIKEAGVSTVKTIKPTPFAKQQEITLCGFLEPEKRINITSPSPGKLIYRPDSEGRYFNKGDRIFSIFNQEIDNRLQLAENRKSEALFSYQESLENLKEQRIQSDRKLIAIKNQRITLSIRENEKIMLKTKIEQKKKLLKLGGISQEELVSFNQKITRLEMEIEMLQNEITASLCGIEKERILKNLNLDIITEEQLKIQQISILTRKAKSTTKAAQLVLEQSELERQSAMSALAQNEIKAPQSGYIEIISVEKGETIEYGANLAILSVQKNLKGNFKIEREFAPSLKEGSHLQLSIITKGGEREKRESSVISQSKTVDPTTGEILVSILIDNNDSRLLPGEYFETTVKKKQKEIGYLIPSLSIIQQQQLTLLYTLNKNRVEIIPIKIIRREKDQLFIKEGINSETIIIKFPDLRLKEGMNVQPEKI